MRADKLYYRGPFRASTGLFRALKGQARHTAAVVFCVAGIKARPGRRNRTGGRAPAGMICKGKRAGGYDIYNYNILGKRVKG